MDNHNQLDDIISAVEDSEKDIRSELFYEISDFYLDLYILKYTQDEKDHTKQEYMERAVALKIRYDYINHIINFWNVSNEVLKGIDQEYEIEKTLISQMKNELMVYLKPWNDILKDLPYKPNI